MTHKEQIINEILSAVTHAIGIGLSIWGLVLLILKRHQNEFDPGCSYSDHLWNNVNWVIFVFNPFPFIVLYKA